MLFRKFKNTIATIIIFLSIQGRASLNPVEMALGLPLKNRNLVLSELGQESFKELRNIAINDKKAMNLRWRAIVSLGMLYPLTSETLLHKLIGSKKWFIRNSAIIGLSYGNKETILPILKKLMSDPSLVVRTSVVQIIEKLSLNELKPLMWKKLYAAENYRKSESLWVRKYLAKALAKLSSDEDISKLMILLEDQDEKLWAYALTGLKKITGRQIAQQNEPLLAQKQKWKNWWQNQIKTL
jgi:HEAT repeat protein